MKHTQGKLKKGVTYDKDMGVYTTDLDSVDNSNYTPIWVHGIERKESIANAERITALWNASNGMTTEQAVRYLEHGAEMEMLLKRLFETYMQEECITREDEWQIEQLIAKMEGK